MQVSKSTRDQVAQAAPGRNFDDRLQNLMSQATTIGTSNRTRQVVVSGTIESGRRVKLRETAPVEGFISTLSIKLPEGVRDTVKIAIEVDGDRVLPGSGELLDINGNLPVFPFEEPVSQTDPIDVIVENRDPENDHRVTVIATVVQNVQVQ